MSDPYVGEIRMFAGNYAPNGWMLCSGQTLPISEYDTLFALLGTTYGGDGQNTFNLPNLCGRMPVHQGQGPGLPSCPLGQTGGQETVTLAASQIAAHNHTLACSSANGTAADPAGNVPAASDTALNTAAGDGSTMNAAAVGLSSGGSQPHDNMSPFLAINFIIATEGIFPSQN
jgi:microcystin-dependent protein